jgi:hypothetical protein
MTPTPTPAPDDATLRARLVPVLEQGWAAYEARTAKGTDYIFHPFIAADYEQVVESLWPYRNSGKRFLEWGSATGVIAIIADTLGLEAYGIELDPALVTTARALATRLGSAAQFVQGSLIPDGYRWRPSDGDDRTGTLGSGRSGYLQLGRPLDDFDIVFGYPWDGESAMMRDIMRQYGRRDALLLLHSASDPMITYRNGVEVVVG